MDYDGHLPDPWGLVNLLFFEVILLTVSC